MTTLRDYVQHKNDCGVFHKTRTKLVTTWVGSWYEDKPAPQPCTCGLAALLATPEGLTPAHDVQRTDETCTWTEADGMDAGDYWESSCGQAWSFIDGTPKENRVRFCHWCGKSVVLLARCTRCDGDGTYEVGGADIESDPPFEMTCEVCAGTGKVTDAIGQ